MRFWDENVPARARTRLRSLHTSAVDLCHILYVKLLPSPKVVSGCVKRRTDGVSLDEAASHTHTHCLSLSLAAAFQQVTLLHSNSLFNNRDCVCIGPKRFGERSMNFHDPVRELAAACSHGDHLVTVQRV